MDYNPNYCNDVGSPVRQRHPLYLKAIYIYSFHLQYSYLKSSRRRIHFRDNSPERLQRVHERCKYRVRQDVCKCRLSPWVLQTLFQLL